jgi:hypothetical protein
MNKVVYIDLTMNYTAGSSNEENENHDESDLTIIGESIDNIRRVLLAMYVGEKLLSVYVLDPTKSRPTLFFKSLYYSLTEFENKVQNKKVAFIDYASLHLLLPGSPAYCPDAQPALSHVLNNLIPRIKPDETETGSDFSLAENEDQY